MAAPAAVAVGGGGLLFAHTGSGSRGVEAADAVRVRPTATAPHHAYTQVAIFLCMKNAPFPNCAAPATEADKRHILDTLDGLPQVSDVHFETRNEAYRNFRHQETTGDIAEKAAPEDMPESYRVRVTPGGDPAEIVRRTEHLPGVSNVVLSECVPSDRKDREDCRILQRERP